MKEYMLKIKWNNYDNNSWSREFYDSIKEARTRMREINSVSLATTLIYFLYNNKYYWEAELLSSEYDQCDLDDEHSLYEVCIDGNWYLHEGDKTRRLSY